MHRGVFDQPNLKCEYQVQCSTRLRAHFASHQPALAQAFLVRASFTGSLTLPSSGLAFGQPLKSNVRPRMAPPYCIDPDHFLDLSSASAVTRDDVRAAWEKAYSLLEQRLAELGATATLYIVFGIQGGGKTTWVAGNATLCGQNTIFFSGPLPSRKHRERALALAKTARCRAVAVWINTTFEVAMERNSKRSGLARIREEAIRHVYENLEPPSIEEGFNELIEVGAENAEA
jgi:predicted kinase